MGERWVEVGRTDPRAVPQALRALARHGVPARVEQGNPNTRSWLPFRAFVDPDRVFVPESEIERARRALAQHLEAGETRIRDHLRGVPGELAVGACLVCLVAFPIAWLAGGGLGAAWPFALAFLVCAPLAWGRLRRGRPS